MADNDAGSLVQRGSHNTIDFVTNAGARRIEVDVSHNGFDRRLACATAVPIDRANDRLDPSPILRTAFRRIGPEFLLNLFVADAGALAHGLSDRGLEFEEVIVRRISFGLNVVRERYFRLPRQFIELVAIIG